MVDIKALAQLGKVTKEITIGKDLRIKLHTLSNEEQQAALASVPGGVNGELKNWPVMQQAILIFATDEVNGEKITREEARQLYAEIQYSLVSDIFTEYSLLTKEQENLLEELKKK